MRILAIETATARQSVAVLDGERVLGRSDQDAPGSHGKVLVPTIERLLTDCGLALRSLDGVAVSIGPGSFTGLRVGLATALGFRLVSGLPVAGVPTLEALAWNVRTSQRPICTILRARTGQVYWGLYQVEPASGEPRPLMSEQVAQPSTIGPRLPGPVTVVGDGWLQYRQEIRQSLADDSWLHEAGPESMSPSAVSVGRAGQVRLARGDVADALTPLYVQPSEAEVLWEGRQGKSR